jgi:hypothetical protein
MRDLKPHEADYIAKILVLGSECNVSNGFAALFAGAEVEDGDLPLVQEPLALDGVQCCCSLWQAPMSSRFQRLAHPKVKGGKTQRIKRSSMQVGAVHAAGASAVVCVYDTPETLQRLSKQLQQSEVSQAFGQHTTKLLLSLPYRKVGEEGSRRVCSSRGRALADKYGALYLEVKEEEQRGSVVGAGAGAWGAEAAGGEAAGEPGEQRQQDAAATSSADGPGGDGANRTVRRVLAMVLHDLIARRVSPPRLTPSVVRKYQAKCATGSDGVSCSAGMMAGLF